MTEKTHSASVSMAGEPYVAKVGEATIALSDRAMILEEVNGEKDYKPVVYFPQDDIDPESLLPSDHQTHCPIKGDASHFSVKADGEVLENAAWTYPDPHRMVRAVKDYVAFYPDKVSVAKA
jgi:uncharacterized protein (DUF427 family)